MFKRSSKLLLVLAALALLCQLSSAAASVVSTDKLESDTLWSGDILVEKMVTVPEGVKLLIEAGTRVRFAPEAGITVMGQLAIAGTAEQRVWLGPSEEAPADAPATARWMGLRMLNSESSRIEHAQIVGGNWNEIANSFLQLRHTTVEKGLGGFKFTTGGRSLVSECTFSQLSEGGVNVTTGAAVEVFDCAFSKCASFGVANSQRGLMRIKGCSFDNCDIGARVINDGSYVVENSFDNCKISIALVQMSREPVIKGNRIKGGDVGILCNQFASPQVLANEITGAKEGVRCYQGSSPVIAHNRIKDCEKAITCIQLCKPLVEKNQLLGNKVGVYLQTSSYATVRLNNFEGNEVHLELGDMMSSDWESRVTKKSSRGRQARNEELVKLGKAVAEKLTTEVTYSGEVDALSNWWGEAATAEMTEKGANANITALKDSFDTPKTSYEGYEGEYALDRIVYADWLKTPLEEAGPEGFPKPPEEPVKEERSPATGDESSK